jgi:hypothetical protein
MDSTFERLRASIEQEAEEVMKAKRKELKEPDDASGVPESARKAAASHVLDSPLKREEATKEAMHLYDIKRTMLQFAIAKEEGAREERANPLVDPASLTESEAKKLERIKKRFDADYAAKLEASTRAGVAAWIEEHTLPAFTEKERKAELVLKSRTEGLLTLTEWRDFLKVFHPDSPATPEQKASVFGILNERLKPVLLSEADDPTPGPVFSLHNLRRRAA